MAVSVCLHALEYEFPLLSFFFYLTTKIIHGMHFCLCLHMIPWAAGDENRSASFCTWSARRSRVLAEGPYHVCDY